MPDFDDYIRRLRGFRDDLQRTRAEQTKLIAFDGLALVRDRVIERGIRADGKPFSDYSPGYARVRFDAGRPTSYKNFSFTNDMWNSIVPIVVRNNKTQTVIEYDSTSEFGRDKLRWNSNRENISIVALSKSEIDGIEADNRERLENLLIKWKLT